MALIRDICGLNYDIMVEVGKAVEAKRKADTIDYWIYRLPPHPHYNRILKRSFKKIETFHNPLPFPHPRIGDITIHKFQKEKFGFIEAERRLTLRRERHGVVDPLHKHGGHYPAIKGWAINIK